MTRFIVALAVSAALLAGAANAMPASVVVQGASTGQILTPHGVWDSK